MSFSVFNGDKVKYPVPPLDDNESNGRTQALNFFDIKKTPEHVSLESVNYFNSYKCKYWKIH